jgi:peptidoglycan/xylan/chitin deacetylase (PgdA/CDA1 family)
MNTRPNKSKVMQFLPTGWMLTRLRGGSSGRSLYLTFDDGPNPEYTPPLLDFLEKHDAKASFFLIGEQIERHPDLARRIVDEGHVLGNHSYSHPQFEQLSLVEQFEEIQRTDRLLSSLDGRSRHMFRPPRGVLPLSMVIRCFRERRRICIWSYDTCDYSRKPMDQVLPLIGRNPVRGGDILLMHDDAGLSLDLLRVLLPEWKRQGFEFRALPHES